MRRNSLAGKRVIMEIPLDCRKWNLRKYNVDHLCDEFNKRTDKYVMGTTRVGDKWFYYFAEVEK